MHPRTQEFVNVGRRAILKNGTLVLTAIGTNVCSVGAIADNQQSALKIGLVTDLHYADKPKAGSRYYRETPAKLAEAAERFRKVNPAFVVELGDLIDAADSVDTELSYLKRINRDFAAICKRRHYVLGNHCVYTLTKQEFLDGVEQKESYYSFDSGNLHFIVLDSCFTSKGDPYGRRNFEWTDANIPAAELEWLKNDLKDTSKKTIVFAHQRLDVSDHYGVKNGAQIRQVLEQSGKVLAVFQGHSHENDYADIGGIHYCTLVAMIEGSGNENGGYSVLSISDQGTIKISGFRKQKSYYLVDRSKSF
jgi:predicted phosphodiesterase